MESRPSTREISFSAHFSQVESQLPFSLHLSPAIASTEGEEVSSIPGRLAMRVQQLNSYHTFLSAGKDGRQTQETQTEIQIWSTRFLNRNQVWYPGALLVSIQTSSSTLSFCDPHRE
jgi:hypothetical protein